ncbi:hypothetical protein MTR67_028522 [Solanum verrucosum]|uniref:MAPK kinase substrate protein n=1 Tax=Solanum verrucosum TaxID=315347 RepID=A0AAF0TVW9_SOLVR|nr:hypothetical protein MTR67_028522 [Solanum verrucosum]
MAGLQRSAVSFRRQGSSGLIWDDKYLSGELINQPVKHKEETNKKRVGKPKEEIKLQVKTSSTTIGSTGRRGSNGGGRVNPTAEPRSPKVSACGLCSAINGKKGKSHHRPLRDQ